MSYNVDIVMCIDATGSMGHLIDIVKNNALSLHKDLGTLLDKKQKNVDQLRIKVQFFRDIFHDSPAFFESDFFTLPLDEDKLNSFVNTMDADGGGDEPESGLEALNLAINSDWAPGVDRQVVVLWTDASAHDLEKGHTEGKAPPNVVGDINELTNLWGQNMGSREKRLVLFAPDTYPWDAIGESWEQTTHFCSKAGNGLEESDYESILDLIASSVA